MGCFIMKDVMEQADSYPKLAAIDPCDKKNQVHCKHVEFGFAAWRSLKAVTDNKTINELAVLTLKTRYCSPSENRLSAWTNHLQSTPTQLNITPSESLATGSSLPWCEWQCLNRLRTRVGRCKYNMNKWGYCDDDTTCDCTEEPQTMEHLLNCPLLPLACTTDDLLIYNDTAQRCVKQWMTKV